MKTTKFIFIFFFLFIVGCKESSTNKSNYYTKGIEFILNYSKIFENQYKLYLRAYGINSDATIDEPDWNSIHQFYISYHSIKKLDINEARMLLINCIEDTLIAINNDLELKPYLNKYPITYKNLHFSISFYETNGKSIKEQFITDCYLFEQKIIYIIDHIDGSFERIHEEPYEEALRIVNNDLIPNIPKKKSQRIYIPKFDEAEEIYPGISKITPK